jgi:subtilisin family serine protease
MRKPIPGRDNPYVRRRTGDVRRLVERGGAMLGDDYVYRPRELLIGLADVSRLEPHLREAGGTWDEEMNERLRERGLGVRRWQLTEESAPVPEVCERLRRVDGDRPPVITPNHLLGSEPRWAWGGGGAPVPAPPLALAGGPGGYDQVVIGVLDTGVAQDTEALHPDLFAALTDPTGDTDVLDDDGDGLLDSGAGHGTFVLGILYQLAPGLLLDAEPVLGSYGFGDDLSIALGVSEVKGGVVNLSFGGYTDGNLEPAGLRAALDAAGSDVVFVAAAGNHGSPDPCWPAAFPEVIAVGAVDTRQHRAPAAASFTNYGDWVDVCAPGVDIHSTYVRGAWPGEAGAASVDFGGYARWSGTSFAAPQVAAAIATLAATTGVTPQEAVKTFLSGLATFAGHPGLGKLYLPPRDLVYRP